MKKALISVTDKTYLSTLVDRLIKCDFEIISTGGTATFLREKGFKITNVSDITEFPEIFEGRVKTLHPKIHGGILAKWDNSEHIFQAKENNIEKIDLVVVNLYPFKEKIAKASETNTSFLNLAIENIDIGGPALIRASAKNYKNTIIVTSIDDYNWVASQLPPAQGWRLVPGVSWDGKAFPSSDTFGLLTKACWLFFLANQII